MTATASPSEEVPPPGLALSVVIPVRNEAGNIAPLLQEIHANLAPVMQAAYEVVYVDDGSDDGTAQELTIAQSTDAVLRLCRHRRSCGQSQATITGVAAARGEWIATLDGDGQNDPADLLKLLAARDRSEDAARALFIGQRRQRHDGALRLMASRVANTIRCVLLGDGTADSGSGMKLLRRDLFLELPRFNALHRFMPALVRRAGRACGAGRNRPSPAPARQIEIRHRWTRFDWSRRSVRCVLVNVAEFESRRFEGSGRAMMPCCVATRFIRVDHGSSPQARGFGTVDRPDKPGDDKIIFKEGNIP